MGWALTSGELQSMSHSRQTPNAPPSALNPQKPLHPLLRPLPALLLLVGLLPKRHPFALRVLLLLPALWLLVGSLPESPLVAPPLTLLPASALPGGCVQQLLHMPEGA
jgi:hypothetical protein